MITPTDATPLEFTCPTCSLPAFWMEALVEEVGFAPRRVTYAVHDTDPLETEHAAILAQIDAFHADVTALVEEFLAATYAERTTTEGAVMEDLDVRFVVPADPHTTWTEVKPVASIDFGGVREVAEAAAVAPGGSSKAGTLTALQTAVTDLLS